MSSITGAQPRLATFWIVVLLAAMVVMRADAALVVSAEEGHLANSQDKLARATGSQHTPSGNPPGVPPGHAAPVTTPQRAPSVNPPGIPPKPQPVARPSRADQAKQCRRTARTKADECGLTCGVLYQGAHTMANVDYANCIRGCSRILNRAVLRCGPA